MYTLTILQDFVFGNPKTSHAEPNYYRVTLEIFNTSTFSILEFKPSNKHHIESMNMRNKGPKAIAKV